MTLYEDYNVVNDDEHPLTNVILNLIPKGKVLDVGCGSGVILKALQEKGLECEGIDPSHVAVKLCKDKGLNVHASTIKDFNPEEKYDYVVCIGTIYYLDDFEENFEKILSFLKPEGKLIINFYNPLRLNKSKFIKVSYSKFKGAIKKHNLKNKVVFGNLISLIKVYILTNSK